MAEEDMPKIEIARGGAPVTGEKGLIQKAKTSKVEPGIIESKRTKEYHPTTASFKDVMFHTIHNEKADVRDQSLQEALQRVDEAEKNQWFKRGEIKTVITDTLETSTWDERNEDEYFYKRMVKKGRLMEAESQGIEGYNNSRYQGMVEQMFVTVANQVSAEGVDERRPLEAEKIREKMTREGKSSAEIKKAVEKWYEGWLNKKMISRQGGRRLDERRQIAERARLVGFPPDTKLSELVGKRPKREGDEAYQRVRQAGWDAGVGDAGLEIQKQILKATVEAKKAQEAYIDAIQEGYDGFVSTEYNRASFDPKTFHIRPPFWYGGLSAKEQKTIVTRTNITNLAAHIEMYGMTHFDEVMGAIGFRIEKEGLDNMWNEMPGFRVAMATMVDNIFEKEGEDHLVISDQGYDIIKEFTQYKEALIDVMEKHLKESSDPNVKNYHLRQGKDKYRAAAVAAVSAADNLLYAGGAYFSGDEERKVRNTKIWQEQPRAFYMPGIKGKAKWIKRENVEDLPTGREENWGGILGDYMQRRSSADGEFKGDFTQGTGRRYMPRRLFFSMFDHVYYKRRHSKEAFYDTRTIPIGSYPNKRGEIIERDEATLAEALIYSKKKDIDKSGFEVTYIKDEDEETGEKSKLNLTLKDYEKPEQMGITQLKPDDLYGYYADVRSHAVPIYKHLTATDLRNALTSSGFIKELNKLRSENPQLAGQATPDGQKWLLWDPDFFEGALAISALKEASDRRIDTGVGFENVSELLLTIPDNIYDNVITNVLNEPRLYYSMPSNLRERLFKAFHANDTHSMSQAILAPTRSAPLSERQGLRRQAAENTTRRLRQR